MTTLYFCWFPSSLLGNPVLEALASRIPAEQEAKLPSLRSQSGDWERAQTALENFLSTAEFFARESRIKLPSPSGRGAGGEGKSQGESR